MTGIRILLNILMPASKETLKYSKSVIPAKAESDRRKCRARRINELDPGFRRGDE